MSRLEAGAKKTMGAKTARVGRWSVGLGVCLMMGLGAHAVGCIFHTPLDCAHYPGDDCPPDSAAGGGGSGGGAGAGGQGGGGAGVGGDGGGGGMVGNCDPELGLVEDGCGVFVSSAAGMTGAVGSMEKPLDTLAAAVAAAAGGTKRVYACAEVFAEAVSVSEAVTIYGGLDCTSDWRLLAETKTTVTPAADEVALTVKSTAGGLVVKDVAFESVDATLPGGSSVAVLVDGVGAEFVRCAMTAGAGAKGVDGADGPSVAPAQPLPGNPGSAACSVAEPIFGGAQGTNDCGGGQVSVGAAGGNGNKANGSDGGNGLPISAGNGLGGTGEVSAGWNCNVGGTNGGAGAGDNGTSGTPGVGATNPGTLTASGYQGTSGTAGLPGTVGQGGGGGGGAKGGNAICAGGTSGAGASGGAGGAGGCGGLPGEGAGPGGGSFALVSINATVILTDCTLQSGVGGDGGAGGDFQPGASGGLAGVGGTGTGGSNDGCDGGKGGKGGNGGPGGGGLGGPSVAVAHVGAPPEQAGNTTLKFGTGGLGGPGGNTNAQNNAGEKGANQEVLAF